MLKKALLTGFVSLSLGASLHAEEKSGFFAGIHGGASFVQSKVEMGSKAVSDDINISFNGGVNVGYQYFFVPYVGLRAYASYDFNGFSKDISLHDLTGNVDVKATAEDIASSGKGPNITSFSRIRTAYIEDPDYMFIILSIKHKVYCVKNSTTLLMDGIMEVVDYNAYDLKFISDNDINYNPALGTGQIQIKDIHYVTYKERTTWEFCQLLDSKYLNSSRRTIEDWYREAVRNKWIKN